jgi:hypothetical protein
MNKQTSNCVQKMKENECEKERGKGRERRKDGCNKSINAIAAALPPKTIFVDAEQPHHL